MSENTNKIFSTDEKKTNVRVLFSRFEVLSPIFIALSDSVRQNLFMLLLEAGVDGMNVGDLTANTHLSRPAISHHLKVLKDNGLVVSHKSGTQIFYYVKMGKYIDEFRQFHELLNEMIQSIDSDLIAQKAPWMFGR
jgi:ArsR family transcriptional regulator